ncbi:UDP-glucose 4-epimerase [Caldicellulosiruptor bescii]|uniref:UDP-glucose 4-epimerase n=2 Tax=Caldicellulosiruptor bescii TaxID=31899 RepID=B9MQU1_CALBD|nr:UDP-glucose 4-epimerase GalE [Caldicellulosiruptor bescii]ACM60045.1 UDP-glucose 4-epimerase [Caldicellulosiruptor bescii DSM 6725]PBC87458.1 UDP-glucose 4-epimerase [Caldicellulosiruptor bescii]PBC90391.1 UDP-glucose 4-epimerase [Caldicellulosiruptor bescii]PBD04177.1 UDP-glucose 4-epimerase [Caldicellulosiruptor bescii]PBD06188.1 UDP-glucose 4-epimerase [Caldicellulosiruptor bescii]
MILVTGGAGYIGSHMVWLLLEKEYDVVVIDNLEKGHKKAVLGGKFYNGDLKDKEFLEKVFSENDISAVIHFAASSLVGESVENPIKYYYNNVYGTLNLVDTMIKHNVKKLVFSSTAAVYGEPENIPILEEDKTQPTNPYGETKLAIEKMLKWMDIAYGLKFVSLRYFNVAGSHPDGIIGEDHNPETHLIPIVLQTALGIREKVIVYGNDYNTKDGTCIRDYIHVIDLCDAHLKAMEYLEKSNKSEIFNLGNGMGFSVMEVIEKASEVVGKRIPYEIGPRRAGDPSILVASSQKAQKLLGWQQKYNSLETIISTAWKWHSTHPHGYEE